MTPRNELGTVTSAVSRVIPLVVVKASGSPSLLVKLLATALTPIRVSIGVGTGVSVDEHGKGSVKASVAHTCTGAWLTSKCRQGVREGGGGGGCTHA